MLVFAFRNLLSRPVRSLLSLLGLTIAIAGMVGLFSVAEGIDYMVSSTFGRLAGLVALQPGAPIPLFSRLPREWGDEIEEIPGVRTVQREIWSRAHLVDGKMVVSPPRFLFGVQIESALAMRQEVFRDAIEQGRFLNLDDRGTFNTVISRQIAEQYEKTLGDTLRVDGMDLTIVGIYHCGSILLDVAIIADIDTVRNMTRFDPASVSSFTIEPGEGVDDKALADDIRDAFSDRTLEQWQPTADGSLPLSTGENPIASLMRALDASVREAARADVDTTDDGTPGGPASEADTPIAADEPVLEVRAASDWGERLMQFSEDLDIFLLLMTAIGVAIAVLSILNTMLMSVSERIIEFGILRANGWSTLDIMLLITWESALIGIGGGILGGIFGWVGTQVVNWYWPTKVQLFASPGLLLFSLGFSTLLGVLGGLYPAIWATRMTPMDAIRRG